MESFKTEKVRKTKKGIRQKLDTKRDTAQISNYIPLQQKTKNKIVMKVQKKKLTRLGKKRQEAKRKKTRTEMVTIKSKIELGGHDKKKKMSKVCISSSNCLRS